VAEGVGAEGGLREEVERLRRDLAEAREQQAATSGVLAVLGRATSDLGAVLRAWSTAPATSAGPTSP
jgi:hypothetical protein